jgi:hypothetical protein
MRRNFKDAQKNTAIPVKMTKPPFAFRAAGEPADLKVKGGFFVSKDFHTHLQFKSRDNPHRKFEFTGFDSDFYPLVYRKLVSVHTGGAGVVLL